VDAYWEVLDYVLDGSVVDPEDLKVMMHKNSKAAGLSLSLSLSLSRALSLSCGPRIPRLLV